MQTQESSKLDPQLSGVVLCRIGCKSCTCSQQSQCLCAQATKCDMLQHGAQPWPWPMSSVIWTNTVDEAVEGVPETIPMKSPIPIASPSPQPSPIRFPRASKRLEAIQELQSTTLVVAASGESSELIPASEMFAALQAYEPPLNLQDIGRSATVVNHVPQSPSASSTGTKHITLAVTK